VQLEEHLLTVHEGDHPSQPHFYDLLSALHFDHVQFDIAKLRSKGKDTRPLRSLWCTFRLSVQEPNIELHVLSHDVLDRSKAYHEIKARITYSHNFGVAICPSCKVTICEIDQFVGRFVDHVVYYHSKDERSLHVAELSQMLNPFLFNLADYCQLFAILRKEFEEAAMYHRLTPKRNAQRASIPTQFSKVP
jgi:hypothetical protein